ncbi:MAG: hypothetical protein P4L73_15910 [Caulobacteraceae bacterium]|nr:hypothetical protein [Caulobacteraceae bacterium]
MKIQAIALAAALSALAGSALADGRAQATLQAPLTKPVTVLAGDAFWNCQGAACVAEPASEQILTVSACRTLVKQTGPLATYSIDRTNLPANLLARCNTAAVAH